MFVYYKCYISIEWTFLKEFMLIRQANQKSAIFFTIGIFKIKALNFEQMSQQMPWFINDGYELQWCCHFISGISKNETINLIENADLTEKSAALQSIKDCYLI